MSEYVGCGCGVMRAAAIDKVTRGTIEMIDGQGQSGTPVTSFLFHVPEHHQSDFRIH